MKKVLLLSGILALGAVASFGTPIDTCTTDHTLSAIMTAGSCEVGDKIFSGFSYTPGSSDGTAADVDVAGTNSIATETFGLQFTSDLAAAWSTGFTLSFNIAIDQTACLSLYGSGACVITGTQDQMQGGAAGSSDTAALSVLHTTGGTVTLNALSTNDETGQILGLNQTTMADTFTGTASGSWPITQFGTEVFQTAVPEPVTFSLMGIGLLGIGLLRKRLS